jgi:UDP-N-acetylmuramoyl-tripeptide--D-alanyl-D-alanine ligase
MGDMGELGEHAAPLHAEVGAFAKGAGIDALVALGPLSRHAVEAFGEGASHAATFEDAIAAARAESRSGATVLVKGSRSMRMERVADALAPGGSGHAA